MVEDPKTEAVVKAAVRVVLDVVLELLQTDPHQWSTRPCGTCRAISAVAGKPFGCIKKAKDSKES